MVIFINLTSCIIVLVWMLELIFVGVGTLLDLLCSYICLLHFTSVSQNPDVVLDPLRQASDELQVLEVS